MEIYLLIYKSADIYAVALFHHNHHINSKVKIITFVNIVDKNVIKCDVILDKQIGFFLNIVIY